jgi:hypothetical protein
MKSWALRLGVFCVIILGTNAFPAQGRNDEVELASRRTLWEIIEFFDPSKYVSYVAKKTGLQFLAAEEETVIKTIVAPQILDEEVMVPVKKANRIAPPKKIDEEEEVVTVVKKRVPKKVVVVEEEVVVVPKKKTVTKEVDEVEEVVVPAKKLVKAKAVVKEEVAPPAKTETAKPKAEKPKKIMSEEEMAKAAKAIEESNKKTVTAPKETAKPKAEKVKKGLSEEEMAKAAKAIEESNKKTVTLLLPKIEAGKPNIGRADLAPKKALMSGSDIAKAEKKVARKAKALKRSKNSQERENTPLTPVPKNLRG